MSNEIALATQLGVGELLLKQLTPQQQGWLYLASKKKKTWDELLKFELSIQSLLNGITEKKDLGEVQENLKGAKKVYDEMKECRLTFTREIDTKIYAPAAEFEKRSLELINSVTSHELTLRTELNKKSDEEAALNREINSFKSHIINEYYRIATEYRISLKSEIGKVYLFALESRLDVQEISQVKDTLKSVLAEIKVPLFVKFDRKLINDEKAREIFTGIAAYNPNSDLKKYVKDVDNTFDLYENDLASSDESAKAYEEEMAESKKKLEESLEIETATNILASQAQTFELTNNLKKTKVKKTMLVVLEDNEKWELAVLTNFIKNWQSLRPLIKSQSQKLNLGQMAAAIGKHITANPIEEANMKGLTFKIESK